MPDLKQIENSVQYLFKDMGDGTFARVVALSGVIDTTDSKGGTRTYNFIDNVCQQFSSTSTSAVSLPTLVGNREMMIHANERCFVRFGNSQVSPASAGSGHLILEPGERFHLRVPQDVSDFRVIRDTTDGFVTLTAVVS